MDSQIIFSVLLETNSDWAQLDMIDPWVKVAGITQPSVTRPGQLVAAPPGSQYRPTPTLLPEPFRQADFSQASHTIIRLRNPAEAGGVPGHAAARFKLRLTLPAGLATVAESGVKAVRFGLAKGEEGEARVTFGRASKPMLFNRWGSTQHAPAGWPHLIYEVGLAELRALAAEERKATAPKLEGVAEHWLESAEVLERALQMQEDPHTEEILRERFFGRAPYN